MAQHDMKWNEIEWRKNENENEIEIETELKIKMKMEMKKKRGGGRAFLAQSVQVCLFLSCPVL